MDHVDCGVAMIGRRLRALIVAILALFGLYWCLKQLQALGAPMLPAFLGSVVPPALHATVARLAVRASAIALQFGTVAVLLLQIAVTALALVALLALLIALRRPRALKQGTVTTFQGRPKAGRPSPAALPQRCPNCGRPVQVDWVACPSCTTGLPVQRVS